MELVKADGFKLYSIKEQNLEICTAAIKQNWQAIAFVNNQTSKLCWLALKQTPDALAHIDTQSEKMCEFAVQKDPYTLRFVRNQTRDICLLACSGKEKPVEYIKYYDCEILMKILDNPRYRLELYHNYPWQMNPFNYEQEIYCITDMHLF